MLALMRCLSANGKHVDWRLEFAARAEADFELIFDHLFESYRNFGEPFEQAFEHARIRVLQVRRDTERILIAPDRGQRRDDLLEGCRNLAIDRASYWFIADQDEKLVTVLAVFFGGQHEQQRMMTRLLGGQ